jgi:hypothetical protein
MLSTLKGTPRPARLADNTEGRLRVGNDGSLPINYGGFFFEQVMRGNGYSFTTDLAGNALVAATTTNAPAIWNPPNSGRLLSIAKVVFARTAKGTPVEVSFVYLRTQNVNSRKGTAADLVSGTAVDAVNLRSDLGDNSGMVFFPTTIATTSTPALWACTGISQNATSGDATTQGPVTQRAVDKVNGMLVVAPGTLLSIGAEGSASTTYTVSIFGLSLPMPLTG